MATKNVKMCDMPISVAVKVFSMLNEGKVKVKVPGENFCTSYIIVTDVEPKDLIYPEGWYYAKGAFRNKHLSTTGFYEEAKMLTSNGEPWGICATYCTMD